VLFVPESLWKRESVRPTVLAGGGDAVAPPLPQPATVRATSGKTAALAR
jgi:hypothetical protein